MSIEENIEHMWSALVQSRRPIRVWLTLDGQLTGLGEMLRDTREVGLYDHRVTLAQFREDVFFVWDSMAR